ncbi:hypothetical protein HW555_012892 [Spodoptera exigua]|uniref:DDE Tnp4 domain-containing protein n=1 Tax=Spodoptera exigua TaxID=7107 RepID=A0A835G6A4_SPOEX|nr:hypothetical protein HW555_012892 [Spodoptera exigua]
MCVGKTARSEMTFIKLTARNVTSNTLRSILSLLFMLKNKAQSSHMKFIGRFLCERSGVSLSESPGEFGSVEALGVAGAIPKSRSDKEPDDPDLSRQSGDKLYEDESGVPIVLDVPDFKEFGRKFCIVLLMPLHYCIRCISNFQAQQKSKIKQRDSGYAQTNFMMTPLSENNVNTRGETLYQESQIKTRNVVERAFGIWKRRFPILSRGISIHLHRVPGIIVATAVLHNLAILRKENIPPEDQDFPVIMEVRDDDVASERYGRGRANLQRRLLIEGYFASFGLSLSEGGGPPPKNNKFNLFTVVSLENGLPDINLAMEKFGFTYLWNRGLRISVRLSSLSNKSTDGISSESKGTDGAVDAEDLEQADSLGTADTENLEWAGALGTADLNRDSGYRGFRADTLGAADTEDLELADTLGAADTEDLELADTLGAADTEDLELADTLGAADTEDLELADTLGAADTEDLELADTLGAADTEDLELADTLGAADTEDLELADTLGAADTEDLELADTLGAADTEDLELADTLGAADTEDLELADTLGAADTEDLELADTLGAADTEDLE